MNFSDGAENDQRKHKGLDCAVVACLCHIGGVGNMNSDYTDRAKMTTSVQIPVWLAAQIKAAGMTYPGAMVAGWNALESAKEANQTISDLRRELEDTRANLRKYRDRWMELMDKEKNNV